MNFPGHLQRAGIHIRFLENEQPSMYISFFGPLLGTKLYSANLDGFAFWSNIQISVFCDHKKYSYPLPDLGYNPFTALDIPSKSYTLNTPLQLTIPIFL